MMEAGPCSHMQHLVLRKLTRIDCRLRGLLPPQLVGPSSSAGDAGRAAGAPCQDSMDREVQRRSCEIQQATGQQWTAGVAFLMERIGDSWWRVPLHVYEHGTHITAVGDEARDCGDASHSCGHECSLSDAFSWSASGTAGGGSRDAIFVPVKFCCTGR